MNALSLLDEHASYIALRVIAEEEIRREHVVVYLSGAHAYGFPSPDSDLDLKAIHVANTTSLVGLHPPPPTFDRTEIIEGVEIDYPSNELGHALGGILRGNGNFIERVLGNSALASSPLLEELRVVTRESLSRRVHRHYRGFAESQLRELDREPTVKRLLYVLRTALTGAHLLRTRELITDLQILLDVHPREGARELIERKRAGERTPLPPPERDEWRANIMMLFAELDTARDHSPLPEDAANIAHANDFLVRVRRAHFE